MVAKQARQLQLAEHQWHVAQELDHQKAIDDMAFDEEDDESLHANPDLHKHIKFELLSCIRQTPKQILSWCRFQARGFFCDQTFNIVFPIQGIQLLR